jgi:hypothetical protein
MDVNLRVLGQSQDNVMPVISLVVENEVRFLDASATSCA